MKRPPVTSMPLVADTMSSSWWASSMTASSWSGSSSAVHGQVEAVEVEVHHDDVGLLGPLAGRLGEAHATARAARRARALLGRHAHRAPRPLGRLHVELGAVAASRWWRPSRRGAAAPRPAPARPRRRGRAGPRPCPAVEQLVEALHAQVVRPALQQRPLEAVAQVPLEERQVLAGQLVLQRLGGGGHDGGALREDRRHEVGERLARAGAGLHGDVLALGDPEAHGLGHLPLARRGPRRRRAARRSRAPTHRARDRAHRSSNLPAAVAWRCPHRTWHAASWRPSSPRGAGFLLAVLWFDLMHDVQVRGHDAALELPEPVLASIAGYYARVTTAARPMNQLVTAPPCWPRWSAVVVELVDGLDPAWVPWRRSCW